MTVRILRDVDLNRLRRVHVNAMDWSDNLGTDFWLNAGSAAAGATTFLLSNRGWTTTALSITEGSGADLLSYADGGPGGAAAAATPRSIVFGASGDLITSPFIFGEYQHGKRASLLLGRSDLPRYLVVDVLGAFTTASANENTSGFGLVEAGGAITTQGDQLACIVSDSANFKLASGADSDVGALVDNAYHWWRIILDAGLGTATDAVEWFIDNTSQGTMDLETDLFPAAFSSHSLTTNRLGVNTVHIYYAWNKSELDPLTA